MTATMQLELPEKTAIRSADQACAHLLDEIDTLIHVVDQVTGQRERGILEGSDGKFAADDLDKLAHLITFADSLQTDAGHILDFATKLKERSFEAYRCAQTDVDNRRDYFDRTRS